MIENKERGVVEEMVYVFENEDKTNSHFYNVSNKDFYICRKCNKINPKSNPVCSCGKSYIKGAPNEVLQRTVNGILYTDWFTTSVRIGYYPEKNMLRMRVQEIEYAGKENENASHKERYTTVIFDYKEKKILCFKQNKVFNMSIIALDCYSFQNFLDRATSYKISSSSTIKAVIKIIKDFMGYKYKMTTEQLSKITFDQVYHLAVKNASYYCCDIINGEFKENENSAFVSDLVLRYRPDLTRVLRINPNVTEDDITMFKAKINKLCINPFNKSQKISEGEAGLLNTFKNPYLKDMNKNIRVYKKYISCREKSKYFHRDIFNRLVETFPEDIAFYFNDRYIKDMENSSCCKDWNLIENRITVLMKIIPIFKSHWKLPDKKSKDFLKDFFKICDCPQTKNNMRLFMESPSYLFYYKILFNLGINNKDCLMRISRCYATLNKDNYNATEMFNNPLYLNCIKQIIKIRGEKNFVNDFIKNVETNEIFLSYFLDTLRMLTTMNKILDESQMLARNGRSLFKVHFKEFHDEVSVVSQSLQYRNISLEELYTEDNVSLNDTIMLPEKSSEDTFTFQLVKDTNEMIVIGQELGICVGTAYRSSAINKYCVIAGIQNKGKYVGCIELDNSCKTVRQVKGYHNCYLHGNTAKAMKNWVESHKLLIDTGDYQKMKFSDNNVEYAYGNRDFHNVDIEDVVWEAV